MVIVSVLTKPYHCPGKCLYCPTQKGIPKSYLADEPAVMRAVLNKFDPYLQVKNRIKALEANGHPTDKIDLRIIGGTWSYYPKKYQTWFVKRCFEATNNKKDKSLENTQKANEKAKHRIIEITIETRPDFINTKEIKQLRKLGITRVELGVQGIYDDILKLNKRGHLIAETITATQLLKDTGFKICYQMMPNLFGSDLKYDKEMFEQIFTNSNFQPDYLKIYPCAILKQTNLYKLWKQGKYKPYKEKELKELIKFIKKKTPYYVRIQRIIRDIPSFNIVTGPTKISNMRQIIKKEMQGENWKCHCIRCREVGLDYNPKEKLYLFRKDYNASNGKEIFLSYEDKNQEKLYSLLRLRIPSFSLKQSKKSSTSNILAFPVLENSAIIREVHTYGQLHPLTSKGQTSTISPQHKGLGKKLIKQAEKIVKNLKMNKIAVISGIGVKPYYKKLGYREKDTYMIKKI